MDSFRKNKTRAKQKNQQAFFACNKMQLTFFS